MIWGLHWKNSLSGFSKKHALHYSYVHKCSNNRKLSFFPEGVLGNIDFQVGYMYESVKRIYEVHKTEEYS
jgi:hypothetical protein